MIDEGRVMLIVEVMKVLYEDYLISVDFERACVEIASHLGLPRGSDETIIATVYKEVAAAMFVQPHEFGN